MSSLNDLSSHALLMQHDKDLYRGNGKPGLTTRMQQAEDAMEATEARVKSVEGKFWAIIVLLLTILGGIITEIAKNSVTHSSLSQFQ